MITIEEYVRQVNNTIELQQRVDKAIEYINNWLEGVNNEDIIIVMNNLGNILKGEKNDKKNY